jgi:hypothetical protein
MKRFFNGIKNIREKRERINLYVMFMEQNKTG